MIGLGVFKTLQVGQVLYHADLGQIVTYKIAGFDTDYEMRAIVKELSRDCCFTASSSTAWEGDIVTLEDWQMEDCFIKREDAILSLRLEFEEQKKEVERFLKFLETLK